MLDVRWNSQITATLNLVRTAFIVAALALGITLMQRDAARLVLRPMERMLSKVRAVAENPLATKRARLESRGVPEREKLMETRILENAINKICSLLAVGFGDAGAEVIAGNMRSGGELDPVVPGRRVAGVFGFCDIRQFTDATEVLQEEVMGFVNTIARIVHREVSLHGGAPNKNVGDAFLLVWMFPDGVSDASLAEALEYVEARENGGVAGGVGGEGSEDENASPAAAAVAPGRELDIAITLQKASFFFRCFFFRVKERTTRALARRGKGAKSRFFSPLLLLSRRRFFRLGWKCRREGVLRVDGEREKARVLFLARTSSWFLFSRAKKKTRTQNFEKLSKNVRRAASPTRPSPPSSPSRPRFAAPCASASSLPGRTFRSASPDSASRWDSASTWAERSKGRSAASTRSTPRTCTPMSTWLRGWRRPPSSLGRAC